MVSKQKQHHVCEESDIQYYQPEFLQEIPNFTDASKSDYSAYDISECISGHLYSKKYLIKLSIGK